MPVEIKLGDGDSLFLQDEWTVDTVTEKLSGGRAFVAIAADETGSDYWINPHQVVYVRYVSREKGDAIRERLNAFRASPPR